MSADLDALRSRLGSSFAPGPRIPQEWSEPEETTRVLAEVRRRHDGPAVEADKRTVAMAVAYFRTNGKPDGWRGLKYVCFGVGSSDERGWCLLSDKPLRKKLVDIVSKEPEPRRQMKCFQALLIGYWTFPVNASSPSAVEGWLELRKWLAGRRELLESTATRRPGWLSVLASHVNLLGEYPCDRYGRRLLEGDGSELHAAIEGLAIPSDSWVPEEAVAAQMKAALALGDSEYKAILPKLIPIATGKAGMDLSPSLKARCVAMLVSRYARCSDRPESMVLRDAAVSVIGNPWLRRAAWDASVVDSQGRPDGDAREMINAWLKRRLITDFFELLSADGTGDRRRLDYWLRFEPFIDDMWFALGGDARWHRGENFKEFRGRAKGRLLNLESTTSDNNAFVMRLGEYLAVEFGAKGNAFYLFKWDNLPQRLLQKLTSGKEQVDVDIHALKSNANSGRLIHKDGGSYGLSWEQKFDQSICPLIGRKPEQPARRRGAQATAHAGVPPAAPRHVETPALAPQTAGLEEIKKLAATWGLRVEDNRPQGGYLWVHVDDESISAVGCALKAWGFRQRPGKGWWRE